MRILGSSQYVVSSPELIQSILRNAKLFSFDAMVATSASRIFGLTNEGYKVLASGEYLIALHKVAHEEMMPGPALLDMIIRALKAEAQHFNEIRYNKRPLNLYRWMRDCFTMAAIDAFYGYHNPFRENAKLMDKLWLGN